MATHFFMLIHGRLKVTQVTADGQQIIVRVVHPGDLFGFARALRRPDYPGTAISVSESLALCWPTELWPQFIDEVRMWQSVRSTRSASGLRKRIRASVKCRPRKSNAAWLTPCCGSRVRRANGSKQDPH